MRKDSLLQVLKEVHDTIKTDSSADGVKIANNLLDPDEKPKKTTMANTWDELPVEMMGERPDAIYFMKERPNDTASSKAETSAPNTTEPSSD